MEELSWERNMPTFPWSNINHHQQQSEETFIFGSENTFPNPIQDHEEGISVIFSDYNNSFNQTIKNFSSVSSDNSVTKEIEDVTTVTISQSSPEQKPNYCNGFYKESLPNSKRTRSDNSDPVGFINFQQSTDSTETDSEAIAQMKEMIYRAAAFRPVSFGDEEVEKPKRRNVRISSDPQTVAARKRREKVSERIRVLQKLVPGGEKMDTASMLDEAANYLKFLRSQVKALEQFGKNVDYGRFGTSGNAYGTSQNAQNVMDNVTLGVPFPMQGHFFVPHQQIYHAPPHA